MKPFCWCLSFFLAGSILLGNNPYPSAADEKKAAEKTALTNSEREINRLIDQLGSERFQDREQASKKLLKLGKSALPRLKEALKNGDAEVRHRAQQLIEQLSAADTQKELAKLQGTWRVVSLVRDGVESTAEELKQWPLLTIKGSNYYWGENGGGAGGAVVRIDPTTNPRTINYQGNEGTVHLGIYEIDGDTLKDCLTTSGERPKEFAAKQGSGYQLMVHKRVK